MDALALALRPYVAVFRTRFTLLLSYRAAALAGFGTQVWWGTVKVMVLAAFLRDAAASPMSQRQVIDYIWLTQAFLMVIPWSVDPDVARMVRTGDVGYERLRPLDTYALWYARAVARRTATPLLRAIPLALSVGVIVPLLGLREWGLSLPAGIEAGLLFALSMMFVVACSAAVATVMDVLTVETLSDRAVSSLAGPLTIVLSGSLIPLPLFPDWMQGALRLQPFAGLVDTPFRIYGGHIARGDVLQAIALQAFWTLVFVAIGRVLVRRVFARLQTQGG